jgi:hypothetical protein
MRWLFHSLRWLLSQILWFVIALATSALGVYFVIGATNWALDPLATDALILVIAIAAFIAARSIAPSNKEGDE